MYVYACISVLFTTDNTSMIPGVTVMVPPYVCLWVTWLPSGQKPFPSFHPFSCTLSAPLLQFNLVLLNELMKRDGEAQGCERSGKS